jgi:hypothetical protein
MKEDKLKKSSLDQLNQIHSMMEQSTRFISLSGLSGILAGLTALIGAAFAFLKIRGAATEENPLMVRLSMHTIQPDTIQELLLIGICMLIVSITLGIVLTYKKASKKGQKIWGASSKRLLINLSIPLVVGGIFALILIQHNLIGLNAPVTSLFCAMALINASKYTLNDFRYLGIFEIVLGLVGSFYIGYGLILWAIGIGVLHIIYGAVMYFKYDWE